MEMVIEDTEMNNIVTVGVTSNSSKTTKDMVKGQFARITDIVHTGEIIFCTYCGFTSLNDGETWSAGVELNVRILQPGEVVNIEIGD